MGSSFRVIVAATLVIFASQTCPAESEYEFGIQLLRKFGFDDLAEKHLEGLTRFYDLLKARGEAPQDLEPVFWTPAGEGAFLEQ